MHINRHSLLDHFSLDQFAIDLQEREPVITDQPAQPRQVSDRYRFVGRPFHLPTHKLLEERFKVDGHFNDAFFCLDKPTRQRLIYLLLMDLDWIYIRGIFQSTPLLMKYLKGSME